MDGDGLSNKVLVKPNTWNEGQNGVYATFLKPEFKVDLSCHESQHTEGYVSKGCLRCTTPTCDACVVKDAFGKREATHRNRRRHICVECWSREDHFVMQPNGFQAKTQTSYAKCAKFQEFCQCTVHESWLCSECKTEQNANLATKLEECATRGCPNQPLNEQFGGRICLWCDLPMPGRMSLGEARREYDSLHLRARAFSTCEPLPAVGPDAGWFHIRRHPNAILQGREDSRTMLNSQRLPAPKPSFFRAHSAADPPMQEREGIDRHKGNTGLLRRMNFMMPSYQRRKGNDGQGWRTTKETWRWSSASLPLRHLTTDIATQNGRPSIVLYEGP